MSTGSFLGVKYGRGVLLTTSSAAVMEEYSYTSTHPMGHNKACNGDTLHFRFGGSSDSRPLSALLGLQGHYLRHCKYQKFVVRFQMDRA
jgi:hypothetical protein